MLDNIYKTEEAYSFLPSILPSSRYYRRSGLFLEMNLYWSGLLSRPSQKTQPLCGIYPHTQNTLHSNRNHTSPEAGLLPHLQIYIVAMSYPFTLDKNCNLTSCDSGHIPPTLSRSAQPMLNLPYRVHYRQPTLSLTSTPTNQRSALPPPLPTNAQPYAQPYPHHRFALPLLQLLQTPSEENCTAISLQWQQICHYSRDVACLLITSSDSTL